MWYFNAIVAVVSISLIAVDWRLRSRSFRFAAVAAITLLHLWSQPFLDRARRRVFENGPSPTALVLGDTLRMTLERKEYVRGIDTMYDAAFADARMVRPGAWMTLAALVWFGGIAVPLGSRTGETRRQDAA